MRLWKPLCVGCGHFVYGNFESSQSREAVTGIMLVVAEEDIADSDKEGLTGRILPVRNHLYPESKRHLFG
jgi:hypothetical protein